jgi:hypothetical protein
MNGVDEAFDYPGGGFVNLDLILRAFELPQARLVVLLGEGTFHQLHGGIATNASHNTITDKVALWRQQYEQLRGKEWVPYRQPVRVFLGQLPEPALRHFARSIMQPSGYPPLGENFDRQLWNHGGLPEPEDPVCRQLLELIRKELREEHFAAAAAVAPIARRVYPYEFLIQQLLQIVELMITSLDDRLKDKDMGLIMTDQAKELLVDKGYDQSLGARPMRRTIQREIEDVLSEKILFGELTAGNLVVVGVEGEAANNDKKTLDTRVFTFTGEVKQALPDAPPVNSTVE